MTIVNKKIAFQQPISQQFQILAQLYQQEQAGEIITRTLLKILEYEKNTNIKQLDELKEDVCSFEKQYNIKSDKFFEEFQNGKMGDKMDYIEWASLIQMIERIEQKIAILSGQS
ncbi:hypothetical protein MHK_007724 [Candidatus Magnetomorum sp. HK-1]|nr:hypothetical protein MHK_007724 [Candidatus Magnetomorum sp. HK-1]